MRGVELTGAVITNTATALSVTPSRIAVPVARSSSGAATGLARDAHRAGTCVPSTIQPPTTSALRTLAVAR